LLAGVTVPMARGDSPGHYRQNDYGAGHVLSVLPAGANGLVNPFDALKFALNGLRPAASNDQLPQYAGLLYGAGNLTDSGLSSYYNEESFGVAPGQITRVERPDAGVGVTILRDTHRIPHVYGDTVEAMAYGAGYAAAEDRLFLMDVFRHYGSGTLSSFIGPSCADEVMDHDQLLLAAYTPAQRQAQIDALPGEYGALGAQLKSMGEAYVAGINRYVGQTLVDPTKLPADYAAALAPPQPWTAGDVISVASLVGGIFGKGGGQELANAALLQYLERQLGRRKGQEAFTAFKEQNDPDAPATIKTAFPYERTGPINPALTALPDNTTLRGGPVATTPGCDLFPINKSAVEIVKSLLSMPKAMSNALLVDAAHSASGHPLAVFGPQVSYLAPEILMQEDLHAPNYDAAGAAFPGTNLVVQLGRGQDYAWSATSASTDIVDQRLELICNPGGGAPAPQGTFYLFNGKCLPMEHDTFAELAITKPGGLGFPASIKHEIYRTVHGIVQGWTTAEGGRPVAVVNQRSTYGHELDSGVGFLGFGTPSLTHDASSFMKSAAQIQYTFNWFYVDDRDIAYYVSGLDPIRPSGVDPNLPTWGTGGAEWRGFLADDAHPHQINPPSGVLTSWNNKPAPQFSASDAEFGYGPVYRNQSLIEQIAHQWAIHGGRINRAQLVTAMETAATVDLTGSQVLPPLLAHLAGRPEPAGVAAMLATLQPWLAAGAHRQKAKPGDGQYANGAAVGIMDEMFPRLMRAMFDPLLAAGGVNSYSNASSGYAIFPMSFVNTPNNDGQHLGSAYDGGWEGYAVKVLRQLQGQAVGQPLPASLMARLCGGLGGCPAAIDAALAATYQQLVGINGTTNVAAWTASTASATARQSMPAFDAIGFRSIGLVGQPSIDWQNRPTFQQVVEWPAHRPPAQSAAPF
jgi:acyl-homoserine lactone acylase PvdQ